MNTPPRYTSVTRPPDTTTFMGATPEQVTTLVEHTLRYTSPGWMRRQDDALLVADLSVYQVAGSTLTGPGQQLRAHNYAHALRRELSRRRLLPVPDLGIPRCGVCRHGTEKLFRTSLDTHDIVGSNGDRCTSDLCVRCWSRLHVDNEESE